MKKMSKIFHKIFIIFLFLFSFEANSKVLSIGDTNSKVTIKVFSSLTCPACAFHKKFFVLKKTTRQRFSKI